MAYAVMFFFRELMYWSSTFAMICCFSASLVSMNVVCVVLSLCHSRIASFALNGSVFSSLGVLGFFGLFAAAGGSSHGVPLLMLVYSELFMTNPKCPRSCDWWEGIVMAFWFSFS